MRCSTAGAHLALYLVATEAIKVAVVGSSGRLGQRVIGRLVRDGHSVKCLYRKPTSSLPAEPAEQVFGDVTDEASLVGLLTGCDACIACYGATRRTRFGDLLPWSKPELQVDHAKRVNYDGVANLIKAAQITGCQRIVRITGRGEKPWSFFSILINGLGSMAKAWNYEGECLLRASNISYTVLRPGIMTDDAPTNFALGDDGIDLKVTRISYSAIADLCVDVLMRNNTKRATLCAVTADSGPDSWSPLLDTVKADRRHFPPSLLKQHMRAVRVGGFALSSLFAAILVAMLAALSSVVRIIGGIVS